MDSGTPYPIDGGTGNIGVELLPPLVRINVAAFELDPARSSCGIEISSRRGGFESSTGELALGAGKCELVRSRCEGQ